MRVRHTKRAARQIDIALDYIATKSPKGAERVRDRIRAVEALLVSHPYAGRATSRAGARRFYLTPYLYVLDYRLIDQGIVVVGFRHSAQAPPEGL